MFFGGSPMHQPDSAGLLRLNAERAREKKLTWALMTGAKQTLTQETAID